MIKKIILSSFVSVILLSQAANSEIKLGDKGSLGTIAFNAGYNTNYIWRGIDQNSGSGSPYFGADLTTPIGFYLGTWTAAANGGVVNAGNSPNQELDIYAGFAKSLGPITADVGVIEYRYPGSNANDNPFNFLEFYGKLKFAPDKAPYSIQLAYFIDDTEGSVNNNAPRTEGNGKNYKEISASYNFPAFTLFASYGEYHQETKTNTVTISKSMFDLNFSASYIDSDLHSATRSSAANRNNSDKTWAVVNISKTF